MSELNSVLKKADDDLLKLRGLGMTFDPVIDRMLADCISTLAKKGADYTEGRNEDRTVHFREAAADVGISVEQAWLILFRKHYTAIKKYVKSGKVESEPIRGRILDAINYLLLFACIVDEKERSVVVK